MKIYQLVFPASVNWQSVTTTTVSMINEGTYKVRLSNIGKGGVGFDVLEVQ